MSQDEERTKGRNLIMNVYRMRHNVSVSFIIRGSRIDSRLVQFNLFYFRIQREVSECQVSSSTFRKVNSDSKDRSNVISQSSCFNRKDSRLPR